MLDYPGMTMVKMVVNQFVSEDLEATLEPLSLPKSGSKVRDFVFK